MRKSLLPLAAVAAASAFAMPGTASAAGWNCSATALSGQPSGAPVAANVGAPTCHAASAGGNAPVITIKRRVSCTRDVAVKTFKPSASGRFAVTIPAPPTGQAAVYRLQTSVPRNARSRTLFSTFTLPRAVELRR
jgi:hypothetical protein